jgi:hypothetical protein
VFFLLQKPFAHDIVSRDRINASEPLLGEDVVDPTTATLEKQLIGFE